jgi:chromosome segregation ATPase
VSATLSNQNVATPLRPLAETAALFRQECSALDHLVEDLYRDVEQLRDELIRKGDELEDGRRKLAQRGAQLADMRKETTHLAHLLEQQEARLGEALREIKALREQSKSERDEAKERESSRFAFLEQKLRAAEAERDQLRHEVNVLAASSKAGAGGGDGFAPLMTELGDMKRQLSETQAQLGEARTQLAAAIQHSAGGGGLTPDSTKSLMSELGELRRQLTAAAERGATGATMVVGADGQPADEATRGRLAAVERERVELESELELVRTRATELQEVVNQQRRELVEQRADVTTELRLLRELVEQRPVAAGEEYEPNDEALVGAASRGNEQAGSAPDPVVSSVMAQFARLQKDVAQRRKKK